MSKHDDILRFEDRYEFLSNFWPVRLTYYHPTRTQFGLITGPSVEHLYQACKAKVQPAQDAILTSLTAGSAKKKGRQCTMRDGWDEMKDDVMLDLLRLKFTVPALRTALMSTEDAYIEEGNTWGDVYWGRYRGRGKNMLGVLIMQVRQEITQGKLA